MKKHVGYYVINSHDARIEINNIVVLYPETHIYTSNVSEDSKTIYVEFETLEQFIPAIEKRLAPYV